MKLLKSVKFRLTLWYTILLTCLLGFFGFLMHSEFERLLYRDVDKNLETEVRTLSESLGGFIRSLPPTDKQSPADTRLQKILLDWEGANHRVRESPLMLRILKKSGAGLMANLSYWQKDIIFPDYERDSFFMEHGHSFQIIHFQKKPFRLYYRMLNYPDFPPLVLQAAVSLREPRAALDRLSFIIWLTVPGAILLSCLLGVLLVSRSLEPVDRMIGEARQITAAYLKRRLPRTNAEDEIDRLAETLNEMMDRIESSTRTVQEFSSNVSHEFKTPLAIIRGEIDLALRRARTPEVLTETLRTIEGEVNELIRLVDDLMLLVRSDSKQLRFEKRRLHLGTLLQQVYERFLDRARNKNISLEFSAPDDMELEGDEVYLKRLFSNLLDNALKFTPDNGKVWLSLERREKKAIVLVRDTGIGIEAGLHEGLFTRFYRTDQARSYEGSGLGLNIAKTICDAHQGTIQLSSMPGKGTMVTVSLPL